MKKRGKNPKSKFILGRQDAHMARDYSRAKGVLKLGMTNVIPTLSGFEEMVVVTMPDGERLAISKEEALGEFDFPTPDEIYSVLCPEVREMRGKHFRGSDIERDTEGTGEQYAIPVWTVPTHYRKGLGSE
jgi:hypothetical protein